MENKRFELLRSIIGTTVENHPSPVTKWLGAKITKAEQGLIEAEYLVRPEMCNVQGILQGGMLGTIIDDTMGATVFSLGGEYSFSTLNLNIDFLYPAKPNEIITAKCSATKEGKTIVYVECWVYNKEGRLLAKSASNLVKLNQQ